MKLLHNYVSLGMVSLLSEAAACAEHRGVAPEVFIEILAKGGGGGVALERLRPYLLARDTSGLRFSVANASKDMNYYNAMASGAGSDQAIAAAVLATLERARQEAPQALLPELVSILDKISLDYTETLQAAAGYQAEEALHATMQKYKGEYLMLVEGSVPTADGGIYCCIGGRTALDILKQKFPQLDEVLARQGRSSTGFQPVQF
jgi:hypothetical protein